MMNNIREHKILIIMPSYNEEEIIYDVIKSIPCELHNNILIVDGGSNDDTVNVIRKTDINFIDSKKKLKYGKSLKIGFDHALDKNVDLVVIFESDGQYKGIDIPLLISPILSNKADFVIGSRLKYMNKSKSIWFFLKIFLISFVFGLVTGFKKIDVDSGFRAFKSEILQNIDYQKLPDDFDINILIIMCVMKKGYKIIQMPIETNKRVSGRSKVHFLKWIKLLISPIIARARSLICI